MKRHPELVDLSREHQRALQLGVTGRRIAKAREAKAIQQFIENCMQAFTNEFEPHFQEEERDLIPRLQAAGETALAQRMLDDHAQLRQLADKLPDWEALDIEMFAECMIAHVRFEEREVFPRFEVLFLNVKG